MPVFFSLLDRFAVFSSLAEFLLRQVIAVKDFELLKKAFSLSSSTSSQTCIDLIEKVPKWLNESKVLIENFRAAKTLRCFFKIKVETS